MAGKSQFRNAREGRLLPVPSSTTPNEVLMDHLETANRNAPDTGGHPTGYFNILRTQTKTGTGACKKTEKYTIRAPLVPSREVR